MSVKIPNNARELEHWLDIHCSANGKSKNLTSFAGNCFHPDGRRISNTACGWYLYDTKREEFADHFVRIYNNTSEHEVLPCLNMIMPKGDEWTTKPFWDIEFPDDDCFQLFLDHRKIDEWQFYTKMRSEFRYSLGLPNDATDQNFAFSRQPSKRYKFHMVYIGPGDIKWTKEEYRNTVTNMACFLTDSYNLKDLEEKKGVMVSSLDIMIFV